MNKLKKLSIAVVALAMCVVLGGAVWAAATNVTYEAVPNQDTFCATDVEQTVEITVKADKEIGLFSLDANVIVPDGWTVLSVTHPEFNLDYNAGNIIWTDDTLSNPATDVLAVITVTIPKNTAVGTYTIGLENLEATKLNWDGTVVDIEYWADDVTVTTQVKVKDHVFVPTSYEWSADNSECTAHGVCSCGETSTSSSVVQSKLTKDPTCLDKGETTYTATFGKVWAVQQVKVVADVPAKGHAYPETPSYTNNGDTHTETFVCANDASHVVTNANLPHDFTNGDCVCGAVALTVVKKGDTISYTVSGRVVTVTCASACKVGYLSGDKYVTTGITMTANQDGSYSFTIPAGVSEVLIVVKGDVTGEGSILSNDVSRLNAAVLGKTTLTAIAQFAGDVTGEGSVLSNDVSRLNAVVLGKTTLAW